MDPSIKLDDVRHWMEENTNNKKQLPIQNTFVASGPHHVYQLGSMFIEHPEDQQYDAAMVCISPLSKYAAVVVPKGLT